MLAVFLGLREGAGATVCCASAAREASLYRQPVLAIDGRHSDAGLSSLFNRTDGDGEDWLGALRGGRKALSALWQYSENLYFLPLNPPEPQTAPLTGPEIARVLLETQRFGFCDVLIDAGASSSATASLWRKCADIVVTVTEADHNSLLRLRRTPLEDNDVLLLNKIEPESTVMREIITYLSTEARFQPHLAPMRILHCFGSAERLWKTTMFSCSTKLSLRAPSCVKSSPISPQRRDFSLTSRPCASFGMKPLREPVFIARLLLRLLLFHKADRRSEPLRRG